jgi:RNA polymerase sigma factor (sigma-70 family)
MTTSDSELLQRFARYRSDEAFAALVQRHVNLVYSTALRQVRSFQLAEEVAQSVFVDLSKSADQLQANTILTAWLYQVTRRTAIDVIRTESRRQRREQIAVELADMKSPDPQWKEIEPLLEDAIETLNEKERSSLLLRYFENKSLREVGEALGISEDSAQKQVSRAVDRLREYFSKRGVAVGSAGLAVLISTNAVQSAPVTLSTTISSACGLGLAVKAAGAVTATGKTILMTTIQKVLITTALAAALGTSLYEFNENSRLRRDLQKVEQRLKPLVEENEQLRRERETLQNQLSSNRQQSEEASRRIAELAKLRGEVTRLRERERELGGTGASAPIQTEMKSWLSRVDQLKKWLEERPEHKIPELQLVTERDWLEAARKKLVTERDIREAVSRLRFIAQGKLAGLMLPALKRYMEANHGKFPTEVAEILPYFKSPIDPAALQRYEIVRPKTSGEPWYITQKGPVDAEFDGRNRIGPEDSGSSYPAWRKYTATGSDWDTLSPAMKAYKAAYGIGSPSDYALLRPFVTTPEEKAALERVIQDNVNYAEKVE